MSMAIPALFSNTTRTSNTNPDPSGFREVYGGMQLTLAYFNGIVLLVGALCNALILAVLLNHKSMRKVRYFLAANLTVADLGLCLVNFPIFLHNASRRHYAAGQVGCTLHGISIVLFCSQSVLTLTMTTYERYVTVVKGLEFSISDLRTFLPVNWAISILLTAMPFLWGNNPYPLRSSRLYCTGGWYFSGPNEVVFTVLCCCVITTGLCGITIMYRRIFETIRENTRRLLSAGRHTLDGSPRLPSGAHLGARAARNAAAVASSLRLAESGASGNAGAADADDANVSANSGQTGLVMAAAGRANASATGRALRSERAIARITLIVVATFFGCWGVYNMMFLLEMFTQRESCPMLDAFGATGALFHSMCNPFMFLFDRNIKSAVKDATGYTYFMSTCGSPRMSTVGKEGALGGAPATASTAAPASGPREPRSWFWRRKKPRTQRNWLDISVVVTVNNGVSTEQTEHGEGGSGGGRPAGAEGPHPPPQRRPSQRRPSQQPMETSDGSAGQPLIALGRENPGRPPPSSLTRGSSLHPPSPPVGQVGLLQIKPQAQLPSIDREKSVASRGEKEEEEEQGVDNDLPEPPHDPADGNGVNAAVRRALPCGVGVRL